MSFSNSIPSLLSFLPANGKPDSMVIGPAVMESVVKVSQGLHAEDAARSGLRFGD